MTSLDGTEEKEVATEEIIAGTESGVNGEVENSEVIENKEITTENVEQEPKWFKERMGRFTAQKYEMQTEIDDLRGQLEKKNNAEPDLTREHFGEDQEAWLEHKVKTNSQELFNKYVEQEKANRQANQVQNQANQAWQSKVNTFSESTPDYASTLSNADSQLKTEVLQDIMDSDVGPQIAYHLAKNPNESDKLNTMNQRQYNRYFNKLEEKFENQAIVPLDTQNKVSKAPDPIGTPKGKSSSKNVVLTDKEWIAQRNAEDRQNGLL